jgi:hypothetical protein
MSAARLMAIEDRGVIRASATTVGTDFHSMHPANRSDLPPLFSAKQKPTAYGSGYGQLALPGKGSKFWA